MHASTLSFTCRPHRAESDLAGFQKKVFKVDDHMGIAISGLIADARTLGSHAACCYINFQERNLYFYSLSIMIVSIFQISFFTCSQVHAE